MSRYVEERRGVFGVEPICRAVGVPVSTYYARRSRKPSRRALADRELVGRIYAAREGYRSVYGVRKTWLELRRRGVDVGRDRVARLMRQAGLEGVRRGKRRRTTIVDEAAGSRDSSRERRVKKNVATSELRATTQNGPIHAINGGATTL